LKPVIEQNGSTPEEATLPVGVEEPVATFVPSLWLLWEQRRLIFKFAVYGLVLFTVIAFILPKKYRSTTQIMPPDSQSGSGLAMLSALAGGGGGMSAVAGNLLGIKSTGELFIGVLHSRTVQDQLIDRFDLRKVYHAKLYRDARKQLEQNTDISEDRKSGIISISVVDKDPQRAAAMAKEYIAELDRAMTELTTSSAHRERVFLEQRLKVVKQDLDKSAREFSEFSSKNTAIDIKEQGRAMVEAAATLQGQLIAAESELRGLEQIYTPNNVRIRTVQARIAELKKQLNTLGGKDVGNPNGTGADESLYPSIRKLPLLGVTYADLLRQTKINEAVYETLTKEYELAKVQEAKEIPTVKVLDPADVPEKKASPPRLAIMLLGTMMSVVVGMVWILGRRRWEELPADDPRKIFLTHVYATSLQSIAQVRKLSLIRKLPRLGYWKKGAND
jgi:uncharacterized protein involved in exopolysaccharide biosynthesis